MKQDTGILILGAGRHCAVVLDAINRRGASRNEITLLDDLKFPGAEKCYGIEVSGPIASLVKNFTGQLLFVAVGDNNGRSAVVNQVMDLMQHRSYKFGNVSHPSADGSCKSTGNGNYFAVNSWVGPDSEIGSFCIINSGAIVEHHCVVMNFAHVGPGAIMCGGAKLGVGAFLGAGAVVRENRIIGDGSVIGMGSVVTDHIPPKVVAYGNPCRVIRALE